MNVTRIQYNSNWSVNQIGMSPKWECHSDWKVTQIRMSLKLEHHSNCNATRIDMSLKLNVIKNKISLNLECHSN